jgi:uncharacterized protein
MITRRGVLTGLAGVIGAGLSAGAYAIGIEPMGAPRVVTYRLTPQGWPPGLKLRIAVLADIHACEPWMGLERVRAIVSQANALKPDLHVLLGDYIVGHRLPARDVDQAALATVLAGLEAPLGRHAILGNHDWWRDAEAMTTFRGPPAIGRALEAAGIPVLENRAVRLVQNGQAFWLAGIGDQIAFQWARRRRGVTGPAGAHDMAAALGAITDDAPAILLAHEPDIFPVVPSRFALTLSGHTHGGQLNLFGWRPVAASALSARYARGHFRENGRDLIVSSGLGCSIAPVRLGVPPEIVVVELGGNSRESPA